MKIREGLISIQDRGSRIEDRGSRIEDRGEDAIFYLLSSIFYPRSSILDPRFSGDLHFAARLQFVHAVNHNLLFGGEAGFNRGVVPLHNPRCYGTRLDGPVRPHHINERSLWPALTRRAVAQD